jgi:hypothetical protein
MTDLLIAVAAFSGAFLGGFIGAYVAVMRRYR